MAFESAQACKESIRAWCISFQGNIVEDIAAVANWSFFLNSFDFLCSVSFDLCLTMLGAMSSMVILNEQTCFDQLL